MKTLLNATHVYRVDTVEEVEQLHQDLKNDPNFALAAFSYKHKDVKAKGEIIDSYEIVTAKVIFDDEKEPMNHVTINYEV